MTNAVTIVTGPAGAGKSTVCSALCESFARAVHLETDHFFGAIRSGYIAPWLPASAHQNEIAVTAAARSALTYAQGGYEVFVDGIVRPWALEVYRRELEPVVDRLSLVVLLPSLDVCKQRGMQRRDHAIVPEHVYRDLHDQFASDDHQRFTVDSTDMPVAAVVDAILAGRTQGVFDATR